MLTSPLCRWGALGLVFVVGCAAGGQSEDDADVTGPDGGQLDAGEIVGSDGGQVDAGNPDAGRVGSVAAPVVDGEPRADHRRPSWVWTLPDGAEAFRVRIDGGAWAELAVDTRWYTAPSDLADGAHRFEVQARDAEGLYGPSGRFDTEVALIARDGDSFWRMHRAMATSPHGHVCAISAHNAYEDGLASAAANLTETLRVVHAAQSAGADLIELDIVEAGGQVLVDHDDTGATARASLADVLDDAALRSGDQILFIEIKETTPTEAFVRALLDIIAARRADYAHDGRHVVLRTFNNRRANLDHARTLLDSPEYVLIRPYVRLSVLFSRAEASRALIDSAAERYDMVEFEYRSPELMRHVAQARSLGLGVNVYTIPSAFGEVFVASMRESIDAVTVDYPIAASRRVVEEDNGQFFLDASGELDSSVSTVASHHTGMAVVPLPVNGAGAPRLAVGGPSDPLVGGRLVFESSAMRAARLYDADARAGEGVFLAAVVRFGTLAIPDATTMSVLAKSNTGGWALELRNPSGSEGTILRFGVYVGGAYHYATAPASALTTSRAHFITCAYDGDGGVRMWIDNDAGPVMVVSTRGGVVNNDVPMMLGADPEDGGAARFYFDGEIQMAMVQAWGAH